MIMSNTEKKTPWPMIAIGLCLIAALAFGMGTMFGRSQTAATPEPTAASSGSGIHVVGSVDATPKPTTAPSAPVITEAPATSSAPVSEPAPGYTPVPELKPAEIIMKHEFWQDADGKMALWVNQSTGSADFMYKDEVFTVINILQDFEDTIDGFYMNSSLIMEATNGGYEASAGLYCFQDGPQEFIQAWFGEDKVILRPVDENPFAKFAQ